MCVFVCMSERVQKSVLVAERLVLAHLYNCNLQSNEKNKNVSCRVRGLLLYDCLDVDAKEEKSTAARCCMPNTRS